MLTTGYIFLRNVLTNFFRSKKERRRRLRYRYLEQLMVCPVAKEGHCEAKVCSHKTPHPQNLGCYQVLTDCRHGSCACKPENVT